MKVCQPTFSGAGFGLGGEVVTDPAKPGTAFYNQAYRSFVHKASP
jgi:hypothetical protein